MKKFIPTLIVVFIIALSACKNDQNEKFIAKVDSLNMELKAIETKVLSMDTADFKKRIAYNDEKLAYIQNNFTDTASKDQAIFMSDIIAVKRSYNKMLKQREDVIKEIVFSKTQLFDLKRDLQNNLILPNSFKEYFVAESKAINNISNTVNGLVKWAESNTARHDQMKEKIEKFVAEL